jgi:hypothetical protein
VECRRPHFGSAFARYAPSPRPQSPRPVPQFLPARQWKVPPLTQSAPSTPRPQSAGRQWKVAPRIPRRQRPQSPPRPQSQNRPRPQSSAHRRLLPAHPAAASAPSPTEGIPTDSAPCRLPGSPECDPLSLNPRCLNPDRRPRSRSSSRHPTIHSPRPQRADPPRLSMEGRGRRDHCEEGLMMRWLAPTAAGTAGRGSGWRARHRRRRGSPARRAPASLPSPPCPPTTTAADVSKKSSSSRVAIVRGEEDGTGSPAALST